MIWYLLYPLRGTTDAPVLAPSHPLRSAFARYGRYAARHVVSTLLVSAAVATILLYPIPFLFTNDFINGASNLPHHAWTVAQPLPYKAVAEPDIIMRTAWIHASYMHALDNVFLAEALELQDELLGTTVDFNPRLNLSAGPYATHPSNLSLMQRDATHALNGLTNQSWFFQSPLQYWDGSRERILADPDVVSTVNNRKNLSTPVNVTLRHSTVFSGKRFKDRRLLAADALVITLLHLNDSDVGRRWEQMAAALATHAGDKWDIYPDDGRISTSRLYEFQFRPISAQDTLTLGLAYGLAITYFLISLSKVRAVKSKVGLMVTVATQICFAIMSSFTICAIFNVDLSRIPRAAYPLVMLAMSQENIFRLVNAVIETPSEDRTINRIGFAVGATGPISMVSSLQNVFILICLSQVVSPGVSAFCIFLAIAIVFDVFYLSTFFLSVLSVDVRRTELSDALAKASMRQRRDAVDSHQRRTWLAQFLHGKTAVSTRIAGTFVMIGFILMAQWHFFNLKDMLGSTMRFLKLAAPTQSMGASQSSILEPIHQARSPNSWLRLQDHETAREMIDIIKPRSHSYIARVYDPLVFVQKGSDRAMHSKEPPLLPAVYDFISHQLTQFLVFVVVVVAALRLLTSYLLWEDVTNTEDDAEALEPPLISIRSLPEKHAIDIALLTNTADGQLISVGLDRAVRVWDVRAGKTSYALPEPPKDTNDVFPVLAMATDHESKWLALLSPARVFLWNLRNREWGPSSTIKLCVQRPEAFSFFPNSTSAIPGLVILHRNGSLTELLPSSPEGNLEFSVCPGALQCAVPLMSKANGQRPPKSFIVAVSRIGSVYLVSRSDSAWESKTVSLAAFANQKAHQAAALPNLGVFLIATTSQVHIVALEDGHILHTFDVKEMKTRSLQCTYTSLRFARRETIGLKSFTLSYVESDSGQCLLHTFVPSDNFDAIRMQSKCGTSETEGCQWASAREIIRRVDNPGQYHLLGDGSIVGIRRKVCYCQDGSRQLCDASEGGLRRRLPHGSKLREPTVVWEAWTASPGDKVAADEAQPLFKDSEQSNHLIIPDLGPKVRVGLMSVAFSFGNVIKLITIGGHERFDTGPNDAGSDSLMNVGNRRRKQGNGARTK